MALCCCGFGGSVKEYTFYQFTFYISHPAALEGSTRYAREIVDRFFSQHTRIDVRHIEPYNNKFRNLTVESRLEIAFAGRPKNFRVPNYKIYKYELAEGLAVVFEVETRLIQRYIPTHCEFDELEVERTDYLPLSGCAQRLVMDMSVSYMNSKRFINKILDWLCLLCLFLFVEICALVMMFILKNNCLNSASNQA
jgi:hypothetical protein